MKESIFSPIISDGMVIQRDNAFPVWSSKKITVAFLGNEFKSRNKNGKWLTMLEPCNAGGPFLMDIFTEDESFRINDIYCGDVWLCGGQSNMEMQMQRLCDDYSEEWEEFEIRNQITDSNTPIHNIYSPIIREFRVPQKYDFSSPRDEIYGGKWLTASAQTLHEFSGAAWFFAKKLYKKYQIPIGLINTAWGGTPVESWMSADALKDFPQKIASGRQYADPQKRDETARKAHKAICKWESFLKKEDIGLKEGWQNCDTSKWKELSLPGNFASAGLPDFCGVIWLSRDFYLREGFQQHNARVWLGTIVDSDIVFINGIETGNTDYRYPPRKYIPKELLKHGKNRIVIRVTCNNGEGGITCGKPFRIFTDSETIELSGTWKYKVTVSHCKRPEEFFFQRQPMGNYNAMIAPVLKFPLKGVIFYQGESNDNYPFDYEKLFKLMIEDWREKYKEQFLVNEEKNMVNDMLPFLFVQLPIWKEASDNDENSSWAIIREAQKSALSLPATGMAAALDLGEWNDLHPINKKDIGYRLFLAAEKLLAADINTSPGPIIRDWRTGTEEQSESNKVYLFFDNCGDGLCVLNEPPAVNITTNAFLRTLEIDTPLNSENDNTAYVSIIGDEPTANHSAAVQIRLTAVITEPNVLCIDLSSVKNPKKILYAWADNPRDRKLFNSDGLPVIPFKINISKGEENV